jgi:hypothetical protein
MEKGHRKREEFQKTWKTLRRERNPCIGEETFRGDKPLIFSPERQKDIEKDETFEEREVHFFGSRMEPLGSQVGVIDSLRRRRDLIQAELSRTQKMLEHKKLCLALTSEYSKPKTLHPAMEQTSLTLTSSTAFETRAGNQTLLRQHKLKNETTFSFENNAIRDDDRG